MAFTPASAGEFVATVLDNMRLSRRYFLLRLKTPKGMVSPQPGQFVHVEVPDGGRFFLRRPFSIHDATTEFIDLLVVEVGPGTRALRRLHIGDSVRFYGPLGGAFPRLPGKKILAVGGGVGLAPLYFYGYRALGGPGGDYRLLYGARTTEDLFLDMVDLSADGVRLASDDGSHGFRGNVVQLAAKLLQGESADVIFSCGPTAMMKAVQVLALEYNLQHFVSLENRMGCALGACRACVVPTKLDGDSPYRTVCHDGPVFDASVLLWDELPTP